ncbi:MAG: Ig-like domain-containing protein [Bacteroidota bacterium]|nr:Ig-like domain-containing protein [Bacteroidota bacterium]MDP4217021.1 Ig-like domain-containing protein [Bacteroidota bacterium]MDP4246191.1 Ig-like domain-containing protein [Bacteroidota bacterium]MDP4255314.1 Ig-like domain-containing protein [Bacteroidota bacterium]MDP4258633.1 Ig-like domain-containing protein [Bacteroidota bacterium]
MKINNGLLSLLSVFLLLAGTTQYSGCANIVPPLGGPRDSIPPKLLLAVPHDAVHHFTGNRIVLNFDEYIDSKDLQSNLIVSPVPKKDPIVDAHLRTITIRLKDTLQPNTTYAFYFGRGIRDYNEGNVLRNFTYVFTTGDYIDSAELSGNVIVASTGKPDSTLIVMLHRKLDDSAVVKDRPRYTARLDSLGHFHFRYLEPGRYALYALKDEGGSLRYLSPGQLFGFADAPVDVGSPHEEITLYAYAEKEEVKSNKGSGGAKSGSRSSAKDKEKDKRLPFTTNISAGQFDVLDTLHFQFETPLQVFDSTKIRLTDEDFKDIDPGQYHFVRDSTNRLFTLLYLMPWPTDTKYSFILARDFAVDSIGRHLLKVDTISFHTKKETEYGEVRIRISRLDLSKNPVLQFVQGGTVKHAYPFQRRREFQTSLFPPGDYELRILYDDNRNGVWDPGEFFGKHRQPEIIRTILPKFTVKANWDNDKDIAL